MFYYNLKCVEVNGTLYYREAVKKKCCFLTFFFFLGGFFMALLHDFSLYLVIVFHDSCSTFLTVGKR